jgi:hypothetical protein
MMAELNLDPVAPLKIEPEKNILQKAGDFITNRYSKEIGKAKEFMDVVNTPGEFKRRLTAKNVRETLPQALLDTLKTYAAEKYGVVNAATMGAPDAMVGAISRASGSDAYKKLKEFKKENALASDYGTLGGTVASMLVPGGTGYTKAGEAAGKLGLKGAAAGLGKLGSIASGATKLGKGANLLGRVGGAIGKGALLGAEQAIPRGIMESIETGNVGKAAGNAALGVGLGGALGGGMQFLGEGLKGVGGLASKFAQSKGMIKAPGGIKGLAQEGAEALGKGKADLSYITDPLEEKLLKDTIKGRLPDLNTSTLNKGLKAYARKLGVDPSGYVRTQGKAALESLLGIMDTYGVRNIDDMQDLMEGAGGLFNKAYDKAAQAGVTPAAILAPAMDAGGEIAEFAAKYGDDAEGIIGPIMKQVGDAPDIRTAKASLDRLMRFVRKNPKMQETMAGFDAPDLLATLKTKLDDAVVNIDPNLSKAKELWKGLAPIKELLARDEIDLPALFSGSPTAEKQALTGAIKNLMTGTGDPAAIAAAAIASNVGQKAATGIQQVGGFFKGEIANLLRKPENLARLKAGIEGVKKIAGGVGKIGQAAVEVAPRVAGAAPSILSQANEKGPQTAPSDKEAQAAQVSAQEAEASVAPEQAEEAKQEVNSKWADKVAENVQSAYVEYDVASLGFSYDEFLDAIKKVTNDFEPTISAEIVFPDKSERTAFLKDYERALQYKAVDVSSALTPGGFFPSEGHKAGKAQLTDFVARVAGQDPMLMDKKKKKAIDAMINRVAAMKGSQAEKQSALLRELQMSYGIDFRRLSDLGLLGVA